MRLHAVRTAVPLATAALLALAVGSSPATASAELVHATGTFDSDGPAYTYSPAVLAPVGTTAEVRVVETAAGTTVATLHVRGLAAHETYAVHAHTGSCSSNPASSGGHYKDDVSGPVDPTNELWLGFTTNRAGNGSAQSVVDWVFRPGQALSVTFHHGGPIRVACLPVAF